MKIRVVTMFLIAQVALAKSMLAGGLWMWQTHAAPTRCVQDMSHRGEGNVVLVLSQIPTNSLSPSTSQKGRRT